MTKFHTDALDAAHTQRELDEIPQRVENSMLQRVMDGDELEYSPEAQAAIMEMIKEMYRDAFNRCDGVREQHEAEFGPDPRHATLRLLRAELAAEKRKEAKARHEAELLTQAIYRARKELGV